VRTLLSRSSVSSGVEAEGRSRLNVRTRFLGSEVGDVIESEFSSVIAEDSMSSIIGGRLLGSDMVCWIWLLNVGESVVSTSCLEGKSEVSGEEPVEYDVENRYGKPGSW
jgi:hypothetical protein